MLMDFLASLSINQSERKNYASKTCQAERKSLMTTKPIINADFGVLRQVLRIFMRSLNLWDLALDKKRKSETQKFCFVRVWKSAGFQDRTNHSRIVTCKQKKSQPHKTKSAEKGTHCFSPITSIYYN